MQSIPAKSVTSIIDGLKKLYIEKLKPLEIAYRFNDFVSPLLVCTISAYPQILQQFSTCSFARIFWQAYKGSCG
jgi:EH domain-containing protein 1